MKLRRQIVAAAFALLLSGTVHLAAQNTALGFIRIDRNPRSSALAGAGAASLENGAYAAFRNAAMLPSLPGLGDAFASLQLWQMSNEVDKTTNLAAGTGFHWDHFAIAMGGVYQKGLPSGEFTPSDYLFSMGVAYNILDLVSVGVNFRYAGQNFSQTAKLGAVSVDLSVAGQLGPELTLLCTVAGLGPKVKGSTAEYSQPAYARLGLSWNQSLAQKHNVELMLDTEYNFEKSMAAITGAEYAFDKLLFVRIGYRLATKNAILPSHLGLGLGVQFQGFRADISYLTASPVVGNTLSFGVGYSF